jgi:hypothetical protein
MPEPWDVAVGTGLLRLGAGAVLLRWRDPVLRAAGADPDDRVMAALFTYFGVRDLALGLSALAASRPGGDVSKQVALQGVADTVDAALLGAAVAAGRLPGWRGRGAIGLAAGTALAEFAGAGLLRRRTAS